MDEIRRSPQWKAARRVEQSDRNLQIWAAVRSGRTLKDVGLEHKVSPERVRQICVMVCRSQGKKWDLAGERKRAAGE